MSFWDCVPWKLVDEWCWWMINWINLLWPSDIIWQHEFGSTLDQVMACCLMAPSHYLNQCWLIISEVQWHSSGCNFTRDTSGFSHWNYLENYFSKILFKSPRGQWVNCDQCCLTGSQGYCRYMSGMCSEFIKAKWHIYASVNLAIIGLDNGLATISWTSACYSLNQNTTFLFSKMNSKISQGAIFSQAQYVSRFYLQILDWYMISEYHQISPLAFCGE